MDQLNLFVREMAESLNTIHRDGWTYPDVENSRQGVNLFNFPYDDGTGTIIYDYSKITAGNFTLSDEVLDNPYNIAGSSNEIILTGESTQSGNNNTANALFKDLVNSSYYDKMNSIVGSLGIAANTCESIMNTKSSLLASVDTQRKSLSSVSLDEEATNLIIFQQSYNAAARIISTLDEMLNTMINNMGITAGNKRQLNAKEEFTLRITNSMMTNKFLSEANDALNRVAKYQSQVDSTKRLSGISQTTRRVRCWH
jgi:hypothetical protein